MLLHVLWRWALTLRWERTRPLCLCAGWNKVQPPLAATSSFFALLLWKSFRGKAYFVKEEVMKHTLSLLPLCFIWIQNIQTYTLHDCIVFLKFKFNRVASLLNASSIVSPKAFQVACKAFLICCQSLQSHL